MKPRRVGALVAAAALVVALAAVATEDAVQRSATRAEFIARLRETAATLAPDATRLFALDPDHAYDEIRRWSAASGFRVTLIAPDGTVRADSWAFSGPLPRLENHAERPEVVAARSGRVGIGSRRSATTGRVTTYVATAVGPPGRPVGFLRVAQEQPLDEAPWAGIAVAVALAWFFGVAASRWERRRHGVVAARLAGWTDLPADADLEAVAADVDRRVLAMREGLQREVEATRAALGQVAEGVILLDAEGVVRYANRAAALLGDSPAVGRPLLETVRLPEIVRLVDEVLGGGETRHTSVTTGSGLDLVVRASPLVHPTLAAAVVVTDMRGEHQLERARRALVGDLAHELRTPLTVLGGLVEELEASGVEGELTATLARQVHKLRAFAHDLEELARIESGQLRLEIAEVEVVTVVRQVLAELGGAAHAAGVTLRGDGETVLLRTDPVRLAQVLSNLVDNGIRYNRSGGHVTATVARTDDSARIDVADDGLGIPSAEVPLVFQRFYRVRRRAETAGGAGLGLAIVKHLVRALGGTVTLASREGEGTTVTLLLPLAGPPA